MENNGFSLTQASNYGVIAGLIVIVLNRFHVVLSQDQAVFIIGAGVTVVSTIVNFVNRFKKGDVSPAGFKK